MNDLVFILSAFALGALHALEPGHGKTVVAAYLVGSKGRVRDAIALGGVVTFTHTFSIIVLGLLTAVAAAYLVPETVHEALEVVSGLLVVGVGLWMVNDRILQKRSPHGHVQAGHSHDDHAALGHDHSHLANQESAHGHDEEIGGDHARDHVGRTERAQTEPELVGAAVSHTHGGVAHAHPLPAGRAHRHADLGHSFARPASGWQELSAEAEAGRSGRAGHVHARPQAHPHLHSDHHGHSHAPSPTEKPTLGSLITLGISGGIVPCPGALALLLAAAAAGNFVGGVSLVVVFSLGLATVLIAIGVVLVKAAGLASRYLGDRIGEAGRLARYASYASAVVVTALGLAMTARAIVDVIGFRLFSISP